MKIDFPRFAQLTFALAAASCERPPPAVPPHVAEPPPEPEAGQVAESGPGEGNPAGNEPLPVEEAADLSRCASLSPSCEGLIQECQTLAGQGDPGSEGYYGGYRPRIAEEIATCWAANLAPPRCRAPAMGKCIREAVLRGPVDAATVPLCDEVIADCAQAGIKARYSREDCQKVLSSVSGQARADAARIIGPSGEGCSLEYALPYYPFGTTW
ncbi:MAG: hypothetical protein HS104_21895 [Polyangiaceae bacterium]|nr:hypothetical protein [Polyangiaceae bacterium]MCE7891277.1 hypothetical protein [Sorangiineae bacterium PRO1]MCL4752988.1 hypothetical protein [Myxococcales bacterium]